LRDIKHRAAPLRQHSSFYWMLTGEASSRQSRCL